jgi:putative membrane protein
VDTHILEQLPPEWQMEAGKMDHAEVNTYYSMHRTEMSMHRTFLSSARSYMSNERTHLSYLRTAISLMSFGVTLNRFSIYLRQSKLLPATHNILFETEYFGLGMVAVGFCILAWALKRYHRVNLEIVENKFTSSEKPLSFLTLIVLLFASFSTIWMFLNRN